MCFIIYLIYHFTATKKLTYLSLGDSLALGENAYGDVQYGYSDYVASYLEKNNLLRFYTKSFAKSGYRIRDLENAILKNETIQIDDEQYVLKKILRDADIITVSIGANDILSEITESTLSLSLIDEKKLTEELDQLFLSFKSVLKTLKKYTRAKIIVVGYYNPFQEADAKINRLFTYFENGYQKVTLDEKVAYISISSLFKNHQDYLPNPFNIHPGSQGYSAISNKIVAYLEENLLNSLAK